MRYDAFISYAHQDKAVGLMVERILQSFSLRIFIDRSRIFSGDISEQIATALDADPPPALVLIASDAAARSGWVAGEFRFAFFLQTRSRRTTGTDVPIVIVQVDQGAAERLQVWGHKVIDVSDRDVTALSSDEWFKDQLWLALHSKILTDVLDGNRQSAAQWCARHIPNEPDWVDFWGPAWRRYLPEGAEHGPPRALLAAGGSGKSVIAAHLVTKLLSSSSSCPVIVEPEFIEPDQWEKDLCGRTGARSLEIFTEHVDRMRRDGQAVMFVVDGLDRAVSAFSPERSAALIDLLAATGSLLVTCRTDVWQSMFSHLSLQEVHIEALDGAQVGRIIREHTSYEDSGLDFLRIPFYLSELLRMQRQIADVPMSRTGILQASWHDFREPVRHAVPQPRSAEHVLDRLARAQLKRMAFAVPVAEVEGEQAHGGSASELHALRRSGTIVQHAENSRERIRLRHDLLDCFGVAQLLFSGPDARAARDFVYEHASEDIGWMVLSMVVQMAADHQDDVLLDELFEHLLEMFDNKRFGIACMGRAWAATYVLRDNFTVLFPLILTCLGGEVTPSLDRCRERKASTLGPPARLTQESASSLASVFDMIADWRAASPEQAIPLLSDGLRRWPMRKRFVEALARYRSPEALQEMIAFAVQVLFDRRDTQVLCEVGKALGEMGRSFAPTIRSRCLEVLEHILECEKIDARTRRVTIESMNMLDPAGKRPVPEVSEAEIVANLRTFSDAEGKVYTDWRLIKEYAEKHATRRILDGRLTPELFEALIAALDHDQTYARTPVARCLGLIDDPRARAALIRELAEPKLPAEVRAACIEALESQIRRSPTPAVAAARRWCVLAASRRARHAMADVTADQLAELAEKVPAGQCGPMVYGDAFEIVVPDAGTTRLGPRFGIVDDRNERLARARELITPDDLRSAGPGWEQKYRIDSLERAEDGHLRLQVAPTTWEEAVGFHLAVRRQPIDRLDDLTEHYLRGQLALPGIAVVHCLLVTSDRRVVLARRPSGTPHSPGTWSASYEEQLTATDFADPSVDAARSAARRGLQEEFATDTDPGTIEIISAIMEMPIANPAIVALVHCAATYRQLQDAWDARRRQGHHDEVADLRSIALSGDRLRATAHAWEQERLHPTAALRLLLLARWLDSK